MKTIYIGNLPYSTTEDEVRDLFSEYGFVHSVKLIIDRTTKRSRGFGYVEMADEEAHEAIEALDEKDFEKRPLRVCEARFAHNGTLPDY